MVRQCFDSLNIYGLDAQALVTRQKSFIEVLKPHDIKTIAKAFSKYLETEKTAPVPAQIRELCVKEEVKPNVFEIRTKNITQIILDWNTDEVLAEFQQGEHLNGAQINSQFKDKRTYVRMKVEN